MTTQTYAKYTPNEFALPLSLIHSVRKNNVTLGLRVLCFLFAFTWVSEVYINQVERAMKRGKPRRRK